MFRLLSALPRHRMHRPSSGLQRLLLPRHCPPRHLYPNRSAAEQAARARLASFNRDTASVRLDLPGRTDLFAERSIEARGFLAGLDGLYLIESVEQVFTSSGWRTTLQCNGGQQGKAKAKGSATPRAGALKAQG